MKVACDVMRVAPVPRLWADATVVCLGSGPSLSREDVEYCRGRAHVLAIKDTVVMAPWADALYSADERWWQHVGPTLSYIGQRFGLVSPDQKWVDLLETLGVHRLLIGGATGLDADPTKLRTGNHSGFSAINLMAHAGAKRIVLLGYDMQAAHDGRDHFFGAHAYPKKTPPYQYVGTFASLLEPLAALGIEVVNATRETALKVFPIMSLAEALA